MSDKGRNAIVVRKNRSPGLRPFYFSSDLDDIFEGFRGEMEKWFRDPWTVAERTPMMRTYHRSNMMPMDLKDQRDNYLLSVELPGVNKKDVKIRMEDNILSLSVEAKEEKEEEEENYLMRERSSFSCERCLRIPSEVLAEEIKANMEGGVLNITIPKAAPREKQAKEISIE